MPIKRSTFGHIELTGKDAERLIQHMQEDKPNPAAIASLERGRKIKEKMDRGEKFKLQLDKS